MPLGDRTGPRGEGPLTGRMMGHCAGLQPGSLLWWLTTAGWVVLLGLGMAGLWKTISRKQ